MNNLYDDIIDLPHHVSQKHPQMPMEKRAAQFSPFAAVSGHDEAIHETARLTDEQLDLSEDETAVIDEKLQWLRVHIKEQPEITITYFQPDEKKNGGTYVTVTGTAKKVDEFGRVLILQDGTAIPMKGMISLHTRLEESTLE